MELDPGRELVGGLTINLGSTAGTRPALDRYHVDVGVIGMRFCHKWQDY